MIEVEVQNAAFCELKCQCGVRAFVHVEKKVVKVVFLDLCICMKY